jgi:hydrogenase/urease accessory protein HupE
VSTPVWPRVAVVVALLAWAAPASAHPAPFSYLDVRLEPRAIDVTVVAHVFDVAHDLQIQNPDALLDPATLAVHGAAVISLLTGRVQITADGMLLTGASWSSPEPLPDRQSVRIRAQFSIGQPAGMLSLTAWMFPYDPVHQTFVNVYEGGALVLQTILSKDRPRAEHFPGTRQGTLTVVRKFALSGIHHILIGPDHLLFIIGLLLLGGSLRKLVLVVSAFTLAHSVTLSIAALGIFSPPAWIVEPAIALSIIYVGIDNLMVRDGRDMRAWIAFAFGLIHGFGFAGVLREMDLPPRALGWSLFSFNLGVEIGQVAVVLTVASLLAAVRARNERLGRRLAFAGSIVVVIAGAFWFIERVFFPSGIA